MRFIYGTIAIALWLMFTVKVAPTLSNEVTLITCAIVAAGAMAGGA